MPGDLYSRSLYYKNLYEKEQKPKRIPRQVKWLILAFSILAVAAFFLVTYMNSTERLVQKYLSENYPGQEFIITSIRKGGLFGIGPTYMTGYPKGGDPETDKFEVKTYIPVDENGKKGERQFSENYYAILIREDVEADVLDTLSDVNLPMKVYYRESGYYDRDESTKTYVELKTEILEGRSPRRINVSIFLLCKDAENSKQYAQQIYDTLLSENGVIYSSDVYMVADETIYEEITRKNYYDVYQEHDESIVKFYESIVGYKGEYSDF